VWVCLSKERRMAKKINERHTILSIYTWWYIYMFWCGKKGGYALLALSSPPPLSPPIIVERYAHKAHTEAS
jgi:hypothetical protein